jgi:tetratricopeptide (TPR) repeat protein
MDLADMAAAIPLFQRILARDPTNGAALDQLEAIYRSAERWRELTEVLLVAAEHAAEPSQAVEWLDRAATITETMLGDPAGAIAHRERIAELAPRSSSNLADLERLRGATGSPERSGP